MAETNIEWADFTFNPWRGCQKVSAGCANCYAEAMSHRNPTLLGEWGPEGKRVIAAESYWKQPIKWNREAAAAGERRRVFCGSLMDVFEDRSELVAPRGRLFTTIQETPYLDWLLLTKRPEGWEDRLHEVVQQTHDGGDMLASHWLDGEPPPNVWLGVSVEDGSAANKRIPCLLQIPAVVRFLSCEPLLAPLDLTCCYSWTDDSSFNAFRGEFCGMDGWGKLHWVIVGGESGPNRREFRVEWAESLYQQCHKADVAFFMKQDSGPRPGMQGRIPDWLWNEKEFPRQ